MATLTGHTSPKTKNAALLTLVLVITVFLAGCSAPVREAQSSASPEAATATSVPSAGSETTATTAPAPAKDSSIPISAACAEILDTGAMEKSGTTFVPQPNAAPKSGSLLSDMVAAGGITCTWTNETQGSTLVLGAAHLDSEGLTRAASEAAATSSPESIPGTSVGASGYFSADAAGGQAQLITDKFWIVLQSPDFLSAQDSATLMSLAESALIYDASK